MFKRQPTDQELEDYGLTREDYDNQDPEILLFDESMYQSWETFCAMQTQWRSAGAGAYGLDYNVLPMLFRIYKIDDEEMALNDIRVMEGEALKAMRKLQS
ncbi:hypothetical protein HAZELMIKA_15 [Klebsiella phage vB_KaeD_HazelMika]|uniref:Tape measure chaperone n=1 Tax=Escherichia phage vB_EcoS_NBD2 TaxID=1852563 RepID=A0A192Y8E2_9CAUD|nr:tail length tape measure protein [Escherichia phage vB_EcoS_NBD2]ANM45883.1 hypothetical protein NBD2_41 [Escherichia phage vB_EcoS_NBD2]UGO53105.1 hypothetical protein HAZELMIKA_15 [Klebsiella phage vB_KaeD_HazelMika]